MIRENIFSAPRYQIGLCQRFTKNIHGFNQESSPQIYDHYLCVYLFQYHSEDDLNFALIANEVFMAVFKHAI